MHTKFQDADELKETNKCHRSLDFASLLNSTRTVIQCFMTMTEEIWHRSII